MTTATEILTQLEELWESAEPGPFEKDDSIIVRIGDGNYSVRPAAGYNGELEEARILERAKPKAPEWEAVVASYVDDPGHRRQVFVRTEGDSWESPVYYLLADELVDPVPLVELPEREALAGALAAADWSMSLTEANEHADALLELLRGER